MAVRRGDDQVKRVMSDIRGVTGNDEYKEENGSGAKRSQFRVWKAFRRRPLGSSRRASLVRSKVISGPNPGSREG